MTTDGAAFEWESVKAASNLAAHGVPFDKVSDFDFATALIEPDQRRAYGETRMIALGSIHGRVISLRRANDREVKRYVHTTPPESPAG